MTTEHAIAIARVSSHGQHEENQEPELRAYAERQGYELDAVIPVKGRSAFHGRHRKKVLEAVEKYVTNGQASVVIFRHVDRMARMEPEDGMRFFLQIRDRGARVDFSEQEWLSGHFEMLGMFLKAAHEESKIKQDRKLQGNRVKRTKGELIGRVPWGYDPVRDKGIIVNIKPNALGKKWIPLIFQAAVDGKSLNTIGGGMLKGIPSPQGNGLWDDATIRRVIASKTYFGHMTSNPNMVFESLVSVELWQQANLAVTSRLKRGRGTTKLDPTLAKPFCGACYGIKREGAPSGKSAMYRKIKNGHAYYVCTGHGPGRKSCGAPGVPIAIDARIDAMMATDPKPHMVREFIAGDDSAEQKAVIDEKLYDAIKAGDYKLIAELTQQAMEIRPTGRLASSELVDSGQTVGEHWQTLKQAEKREELGNYTVIIGLGKNKQPYAVIAAPGSSELPEIIEQINIKRRDAEVDD